jgi:hypothetical protein
MTTITATTVLYVGATEVQKRSFYRRAALKNSSPAS